MSRYKQPYTLFKRGKYYYYRTYTYNGIRTVAKTTGKTSKGAAKQYCDNLFLTGTLANKSITFYDFAKNFFDDDSPYVKDRQKPLTQNSLYNYRSHIKTLLNDLGKIKLEDINYLFLKNYRISLIEKYSSSTVHIKMCIIKEIIDFAFRSNIISVNPFVYLESMQNTTKERDALTLKEVKELYNKVPPEYKNNILLLALSGMRCSEFAAFPSGGEIIKSDNIEYYDLKFQLYKEKLIPPKQNSCRQIPLIPELLELSTFFSMPFYRSMLKYIKTFPNSDERKLSLHSLRHFFITNAKSYGVPSIKVEYLAGHKFKKIEKVYTNFRAEDCTEILKWQKTILDQILQP